MGPLEIAEHLKEKFPDSVTGTGEFRSQAWTVVDRKAIFEVCRYLKEAPDMGFGYLRDLTAVDYLGKRDARFEVVYHLYNITAKQMLRLKVPVEERNCNIDSVTSLWSVADWHERECYDLFGITFNGHPDHRRILMPEDWSGHPLRKDYPVTGPSRDNDWEGFMEVRRKAEQFKEFEWNR